MYMFNLFVYSKYFFRFAFTLHLKKLFFFKREEKNKSFEKTNIYGILKRFFFSS